MADTASIILPLDHYAHPGAPAEWWWHIGTVRSGERVFGFEVNATGRADGGDPGTGATPFGFMQIMVTDVAGGVHYQTTAGEKPLPETWAEANTAKPWSVRLAANDGTDASISMLGAVENCLDMNVQAQFTDAATGTRVAIALRFVQSGPPLLVTGTGCIPVNNSGKTPLERNNYYYSLTKLAASGTISIGDESWPVEGVTWMDHEYGWFGGKGGVNWVLQDMQLDNGITLSSFAIGATPKKDVPYFSVATILGPDGTSSLVGALTTPRGDPIQSKGDPGVEYYLQMDVDFLVPWAQLSVISLFADQEFPISEDAIYEGAARVTGKYDGQDVVGTGWIEQKIKPSADMPVPSVQAPAAPHGSASG
jgi:predicted secreted hydrolase